MQLFVALISWQGQTEAAQHIARIVHPHSDTLVVIYSNVAETPENGPGDWHQTANSQFFGGKFRKALDLHDGGIFLLIHADTDFADWPALLTRCRTLFQDHSDLGIWSPNFTNTYWTNARVHMGDGPGPGLITVAQTDGIVFALSPTVVDRLHSLDYSANHYGWGIDWAATAYCHSRKLLVCRDTRLVVTHPESRGYEFAAAWDQAKSFLTQLTPQESHHLTVLRRHVLTRIRRETPLLRRLLRAAARRLGSGR